MGGDGHVDVRLDDLDRIASTLREGASRLDGPAKETPDPPDAAQSTGAVAGALEEIGAAVVALRKDLDEMAANVANSHGDYRHTEVDNANRLNDQMNGG